MRLWSSWISGRNRFWKSILVNTTLVVLVIWGVGQWHARNLLPESDAEAVPDFELQSLVGTSHSLHASDGAVFLYFFAPWCTVCRFSISNLNDLPVSSTKNDSPKRAATTPLPSSPLIFSTNSTFSKGKPTLSRKPLLDKRLCKLILIF